MANRVKTGDNVIVITGKDKGKVGKVLSVSLKSNKVLVSGVAMVKKSSKDNNQGFVYKESFIDCSNVMHFDSKIGKPSRIGFKVLENGEKVRFYKKSGSTVE